MEGVGGVEEEERGSPLPSQLRPQDSPLKPNDTRQTPKIMADNLALSCLVLKRLIRNF